VFLYDPFITNIRKKFVKNENIDVYLQPLFEELEMLWVGVMTIDVTRLKGSWSFCLKAICTWNIHDFPAYGLFAKCHVKGVYGMPFMSSKCGYTMIFTPEKKCLG
jgi:hypothetical protein